MEDKINYRQQWFDGEIEAGTLLDTIDRLSSEVGRYKVMSDNYYVLCVDKELENAKLRVEVEQLRKDAGRYRWLRENASDAHMWNDESIDAAINKNY